MPAPAVEMRNIVKIYPDGTVALRGVDLVVQEREYHCLLGENGAGKTTLMRILYGEIEPTEGEIRVFGEHVRFRGPWEAMRRGIVMVYQHFSLIPVFTIADNIALAASTLGIPRVEAIKRARRIIEEMGIELPLDQLVERLPVGLQQRAEIVKALALGARILILDEPTSVLSPPEAEALFKILRGLKSKGLTLIYITHRLREVRRVCDNVTILRRGQVVARGPVEAFTDEELAKLMVGRAVGLERRFERSGAPGEPVLTVSDLWVRGDRGEWAVQGVSFQLRSGEILGVAGVQGNGQRELLEALAGLRRIEKGRVRVLGRDATDLSVEERYKLGLAYVPESRAVGLVPEMTVVENSILTQTWRFSSRGVIDQVAATEWARRIVEEYGVVAPGLRAKVKVLSGGNQQKLMIGREALRAPKILLVAEPTHGLDVAATMYVRGVLAALRDRGHAILLVSSDLDELLQLSDRLAVMYHGRFVSLKPTESYTISEIGLLMTKGAV